MPALTPVERDYSFAPDLVTIHGVYTYLSVCLFNALSIYLSISLYICLSVYLSVGTIFSYIANFFPLLLTSSSPANGGRICSGPGYQFQICNAHECEDPYLDYRAEQCSMMDNKFEYQNTWHHWLPYEHPDRK